MTLKVKTDSRKSIIVTSGQSLIRMVSLYVDPTSRRMSAPETTH